MHSRSSRSKVDTRLCELPSRQTKQGHTIGHMTTGPTREENKSGRLPTAGPGADRWVQRQEAGSSDQTTPKQETAGKPSIKPCGLKSPADGPSRSPGAASSAQSCGCRARRRPAPAQGDSSTRRTLDLEELLVQKPKASTRRVRRKQTHGAGLLGSQRRLTCLPRDDTSLERPV